MKLPSQSLNYMERSTAALVLAAFSVLYVVLLLGVRSESSVIPLMVCVGIISVLVTKLTTGFDNLLQVVFGAVIFSLFLQFSGEIFGSWVTTRAIAAAMFLVLIWGWFLVSTKDVKRLDITAREMISKVLTFLIPVLGCIYWISMMSTERKVNILGYGYDNVGHLVQARMVLDSGGTALLTRVLDYGPTYVQDSHQAAASLLATLVILAGISEKSVSGLLSVQLFVTILIPILLLQGVLTVGFRGSYRTRMSLLSAVAVSAVLLGTYTSRIWFSGWLSSNLAILCLALLAMQLATRQRTSSIFLIAAFVVIGQIYILFAVIAFLLVAPRLTAVVGTEFSRRPLRWSSGKLVVVGVGVLLTASLILPVMAVQRSFGAQQFLAAGGGESPPIREMFAMVILIFGPLIAFTPKSRIVERALTVGALTTLAIALWVTSMEQHDYVSYYPMKFIVAIFVIALCYIVGSFCQATPRRSTKAVSVIVAFVAVATMLFGSKGTTFTTAYMGTVSSVARQISNPSPIVVNGGDVEHWSSWANKTDVPVLYLTSAYESELNTRWINTLAETWTDDSWSTWMLVRDLLASTSPPSTSTDLKNLVVVSDSQEILERAEELGIASCSIQNFDKCQAS